MSEWRVAKRGFDKVWVVKRKKERALDRREREKSGGRRHCEGGRGTEERKREKKIRGKRTEE